MQNALQNKNLTQIQEQIASWALWVIARKKTIIMIWIPPHFPVTSKYIPVYSGILRGYMEHCCASHLNRISFDQTKLLKSENMWHFWWYFEVPKSLNRVILLMEESWDHAKTLQIVGFELPFPQPVFSPDFWTINGTT